MTELSREVHKAAILKKTNELGITTDGKQIKQIAHEVKEESINQSAVKLGIETKDKTTREILDEILTNYHEEARKQKLFPFNEGMHNIHLRLSEPTENEQNP